LCHNRLLHLLVLVQSTDSPGEQSTPKSPPRLIIAAEEDVVKAVVVVADTIVVDIDQQMSACEIVLSLTACYYAWSLDYPKQYQILVFFFSGKFVER
jgi:hypothetical protein